MASVGVGAVHVHAADVGVAHQRQRADGRAIGARPVAGVVDAVAVPAAGLTGDVGVPERDDRVPRRVGIGRRAAGSEQASDDGGQRQERRSHCRTLARRVVPCAGVAKVGRREGSHEMRGVTALAWASLAGTAQAEDLVVNSFDGTPIVAHWFPNPVAGRRPAGAGGAQRPGLERARRERSVDRGDQAPPRPRLQRAHLGPARLRRLRRRGDHQRAAGGGPRRAGAHRSHGPAAAGDARQGGRPPGGHDRRQLRRRHPALHRRDRPPRGRDRAGGGLALARDEPLQGPDLQAGVELAALFDRAGQRHQRRTRRRPRRSADRRARSAHHLRVQQRHRHRQPERRRRGLVQGPRPWRQDDPQDQGADADRGRHRGHAVPARRGREGLQAAEGPGNAGEDVLVLRRPRPVRRGQRRRARRRARRGLHPRQRRRRPPPQRGQRRLAGPLPQARPQREDRARVSSSARTTASTAWRLSTPSRRASRSRRAARAPSRSPRAPPPGPAPWRWLPPAAGSTCR